MCDAKCVSNRFADLETEIFAHSSLQKRVQLNGLMRWRVFVRSSFQVSPQIIFGLWLGPSWMCLVLNLSVVILPWFSRFFSDSFQQDFFSNGSVSGPFHLRINSSNLPCPCRRKAVPHDGSTNTRFDSGAAVFTGWCAVLQWRQTEHLAFSNSSLLVSSVFAKWLCSCQGSVKIRSAQNKKKSVK